MRRGTGSVRIFATALVAATIAASCSSGGSTNPDPVAPVTAATSSTSTSTTLAATTTTLAATTTQVATTTTQVATTTTQPPESWAKQALRAATAVHAATADLAKLRPFIDEFTPNPFHIPLPAGLTLYDLQLDTSITGSGVSGILAIFAHSTLSTAALQHLVLDTYRPRGLTLIRHETTRFGSIVREWADRSQTQFLHIDVSPGDHGVSQLTIDLDIWSGATIGDIDLPILRALAPLAARPSWTKFADVNIQFDGFRQAVRFSSQVSAPLSKFDDTVAFYRVAHRAGSLRLAASSPGDAVHSSGYWNADGAITFDGLPARLQVLKPDQPYSPDVGTLVVLSVYVGGPPPS
jgi:hypothetical protein